MDEQMDSLEEIRKMVPDVVSQIERMMHDDKTPAMVKVRLMEMVLERTFGRPEASVKLTTAQQGVEAAQARIAAIVERIKIGEA